MVPKWTKYSVQKITGALQGREVNNSHTKPYQGFASTSLTFSDSLFTVRLEGWEKLFAVEVRHLDHYHFNHWSFPV